MRFLVAGGSGFVGSHLCRRLVLEGHLVTCVDNLLTGQRSNIADLEALEGFSFVEADVAQLTGAALGEREIDVVLHLASPASPVDYDRYPLAMYTST